MILFFLRKIVVRCWKRKSNRRSEATESSKTNCFTSNRILQK